MTGLKRAPTLSFLLVIMCLVSGGCVTVWPFHNPAQPVPDSPDRYFRPSSKIAVLVRDFSGESCYVGPGQITDELAYVLVSSGLFDVWAPDCPEPPCAEGDTVSGTFARPSVAPSLTKPENVDFIICGTLLQADLRTDRGEAVPGIFYCPEVRAVVSVELEVYDTRSDVLTLIKRVTSEEASRRLPQVMTLTSFNDKEASLLLSVTERGALFDRAISELVNQVVEEIRSVAYPANNNREKPLLRRIAGSNNPLSW